MKLPDKFVLKVLEKSTGGPVQNVAVVFELFCRHKNNYVVGPLITDTAGETVFSRAACEQSIEIDKSTFVMDYVDSLIDCKPTAEIRLHSPESIRAMISNYNAAPKFWGRGFVEPESLFARLANVANAAFEPAKVIVTEQDLVNKKEVVLYVRRKSNSDIWQSLEAKKNNNRA